MCQEEYDGLSFADYPVRKGWQDPNTETINLSQSPQEDQSAFLQTWLYFGMLTEVLGFPLKTQDFVEDKQVTTKRLPEYTHRWREQLLSMPETRRRERYAIAQGCLMKARDNCLRLLDESKPECPLTPEIRLTIRILGERH